MTLSNQTMTVPYTAVGNTGETFDIPFPFRADSEIFLLEAGVLQVQGTIYTITGAGTATGGAVTYVGAPAAAAVIIINRIVPLTQEADLKETGKFSAEAVEDTLDENVKMSQQSMQRNATDGNTFDAQGLKIEDAADPTAAQDVTTKAYVDAIVISSGNVPTPVDPDDDGKHLEASGGTAAWATTNEVPTPVAGDVSGDKMLQATSAAVGGFAFRTVPAAGGRARNLLLNGNMSVAQNGTSFTAATVPLNSDATTLLDRWRLLSDGNDVVDVTQDTSVVPDGALYSMLADVETANKKFGFVQVLENVDSMRAFNNQNGVVSVSFEAHLVGTTVSTLRAGILSWVGTADAVTADVLTAWGAAGTDPTLATSWAYENTPSDLALVASTWTKFTITNVALNTSGINNIALFIWIDDTDATVGDFLYISNVQMVIGDVVDDPGHRPFAEELALCQRYLQVFSAGAVEEPFGAGINITTATSSFMIPLMNTMFKKPTAVTVGSAATDFQVASEATVDACSAVTFATATPNMVKLDATHSVIGNVGFGVMLEAVNSSAKLTFVAEPIA